MLIQLVFNDIFFTDKRLAYGHIVIVFTNKMNTTLRNDFSKLNNHVRIRTIQKTANTQTLYCSSNAVPLWRLHH